MRNPLFRLLPYVRPHRRMLTLSALLRIVNLGLGMAVMALSALLLANAAVAGRSPSPEQWMLLIGGGLLKAAARYAEQVSGHVAAFRILDTLRGELFDGFSGQEADVRSQGRAGDVVSRAMADVELVEVFFAHTLAPVAAALVYVISVVVVAGTWLGIVPALVLTGLLLGAAILVPGLFQRINLRAGAQTRTLAGTLSAEIGENLAGVQDLITLGAFSYRATMVRNSGKNYARRTAALTRRAAVKSALVDLLLIATLGFVAWYGLSTARQGGIASATVWSSVAALAGGFGAILGVSRAVDDLPKSSAAAARVLEFIERPPNSSPLRRRSDGKDSSPTDGVIGKDLRYQFPTGGGIQNVSFSVRKGEHLFVTGPSGSGKSTLASIVLRLVTPQSGRLTVSLHGKSNLSDSEYRALVSAVPQDVGLVRGSVVENVRLGLPTGDAPTNKPHGDSQPIPEAAFAVPDLAALFDELPDGDQTLIGGADEQISGGQKKRIAIARMIARDPEIVVLDEAFAGLDRGNRAQIRNALLTWAKSAGKGVIEFSHELADAEEADGVIVLKNGSVAQRGTWVDLAESEGLFSSLLEAQQT